MEEAGEQCGEQSREKMFNDRGEVGAFCLGNLTSDNSNLTP